MGPLHLQMREGSAFKIVLGLAYGYFLLYQLNQQVWHYIKGSLTLHILPFKVHVDTRGMNVLHCAMSRGTYLWVTGGLFKSIYFYMNDKQYSLLRGLHVIELKQK